MLKRLVHRLVAKPWGRTMLPPPFNGETEDRIGEIWYETPGAQALPLMVKRIFTSERLSVQVHPNDAVARTMGFAHGKDEAWYIIDCAPDAVIGLGLKAPLSIDAFHSAAGDGRIVDIIEWRPVAAGDFIYVPAGTIHAIGANISLIEIQRNIDLTFRLYDYGRPRPLHLEDGAKASHLDRYYGDITPMMAGNRQDLAGQKRHAFQVELMHWQPKDEKRVTIDRPVWFVPLKGRGTIGDLEWTVGECWVASESVIIQALTPASGLIASEK